MAVVTQNKTFGRTHKMCCPEHPWHCLILWLVLLLRYTAQCIGMPSNQLPSKMGNRLRQSSGGQHPVASEVIAMLQTQWSLLESNMSAQCRGYEAVVHSACSAGHIL